jgi:hypothetical protein
VNVVGALGGGGGAFPARPGSPGSRPASPNGQLRSASTRSSTAERGRRPAAAAAVAGAPAVAELEFDDKGIPPPAQAGNTQSQRSCHNEAQRRATAHDVFVGQNIGLRTAQQSLHGQQFRPVCTQLPVASSIQVGHLPDPSSFALAGLLPSVFNQPEDGGSGSLGVVGQGGYDGSGNHPAAEAAGGAGGARAGQRVAQARRQYSKNPKAAPVEPFVRPVSAARLKPGVRGGVHRGQPGLLAGMAPVGAIDLQRNGPPGVTTARPQSGRSGGGGGGGGGGSSGGGGAHSGAGKAAAAAALSAAESGRRSPAPRGVSAAVGAADLNVAVSPGGGTRPASEAMASMAALAERDVLSADALMGFGGGFEYITLSEAGLIPEDQVGPGESDAFGPVPPVGTTPGATTAGALSSTWVKVPGVHHRPASGVLRGGKVLVLPGGGGGGGGGSGGGPMASSSNDTQLASLLASRDRVAGSSPHSDSGLFRSTVGQFSASASETALVLTARRRYPVAATMRDWLGAHPETRADPFGAARAAGVQLLPEVPAEGIFSGGGVHPFSQRSAAVS